MEFIFNRSGSIGVITISDSMGKEDPEKLRHALLICMWNSDHLFVNFRKVTYISTANIKVICEVYHIFQKLKKRMTLVGDKSEFSRRILREPDVIYSKCIYKCKGDCLWTKSRNGGASRYRGGRSCTHSVDNRLRAVGRITRDKTSLEGGA